MSSSCIEDVRVPDDDWYRITNELLSRAGITINGPAPADIRVKNPDFFKRVLQEGSLGLGESYMDGWWECDRLDMFFSKVLRAGLENQLPATSKIRYELPLLACSICRPKTCMGCRQRTLRFRQRSLYSHVGPLYAVFLRLLERCRHHGICPAGEAKNDC